MSFKMWKLLYLLLVVVLAGETSQGKSDCEEHRERELKSNNPVRLVPTCDKNGDYEPMQCFEDRFACACWDKVGRPLTPANSTIKSCDCVLENYNARKQGLLGGYIPQCSDDGRYEKVQCHAGTGFCWCADTNTGKNVTKPARGSPTC
ncbi:U24-ctenitoxin-Pn1a-like [Uloborus diversus]|uniref:U24-ctenitoxin-Pn1a-like n=1 Tax=Uloborus diversus TaxID=327109 RepID=UPI00240A6FC9|nr:U24-ctenitoxin-Pn1a-like [Uloborus diversus]